MKKKLNAAIALMDPMAHCVATVRRIIDEHIDQMPSERWSELITELRDNVDTRGWRAWWSVARPLM